MASDMRVVPRVARWSLDLALLAVVALSLALLFAGTVLPAFERQMLIINSGSMAPAVPAGSIIIINERPERIAAGDVVTIQSSGSGSVFTHRVLETVSGEREPELRTQGDANAAPDAVTYPLSTVVGAVELSVPHIGWLVAGIQTNGGRMVLLSSLLLLVALRWFWDDIFGDEANPATVRQTAADPQVRMP
jgi:signal peptidase I